MSTVAIEVLATLAIAWVMVLAAVKKKALTMRGERTCLVCKQPLSRCRCYRMP